MKKLLSGILLPALLLSVGSFFSSCEKNANGRNTLNLVDDASITSLANTEYTNFLSANPPITGTPAADMVQRVGARLVIAINTYLSGINKSNLVSNYQWEYNLVNNAELNAWCMPGGKIVVYSGILPITITDTDLAVVMGHEIAHAVLKHGNERMSEQLLAEYGGQALAVILSSKPAETQTIFNTAYGVGSTLGSLAFSRKQESEADEMGLYFMAVAGYNPTAAIGFWERMSAVGGAKPPEILSTHPSDATRIQNIKDLLPKALTYYRP